jgi:hypothetical protein
MDLAERLQALQELNEAPLPHEIPKYSDQELKERFEDLLAEGLTQPEAAKRLGKTATQMRYFRSQKSIHFDAEHAKRVEEIMAPDGENRTAMAENALKDLAKAAADGNVRAIEKILMAYHPDFSFMRPPAFSGDVNVEKLMIVMRDLPTPILEQARDALLAKKRELPVIDAV